MLSFGSLRVMHLTLFSGTATARRGKAQAGLIAPFRKIPTTHQNRQFIFFFLFISTDLTTSGCPLGETFRQTSVTSPSGLIRNVSLDVPNTSLPNSVVGFQES